MTYEYLQEKMQEYLLTVDNNSKDEWYCTERDIQEVGLECFLQWLPDNA